MMTDWFRLEKSWGRPNQDVISFKEAVGRWTVVFLGADYMIEVGMIIATNV